MIKNAKTFFWIETGEGNDGCMVLRLKEISQSKEDGNGGVTGLRLCVKGLEQYGTDPYILEKQMEVTDSELQVSCPGVRLWDPEHPNLYQVTITVQGKEGQTAVQEQKIGFRLLERNGKQLLWNHRPLKLKGVCYRERKGDMEGTRQDLELFHRANVNFIRGIYAPFSEDLLKLCDRYGLLVENTAPFCEIGQTRAAVQDLPHLREAFMEPVKEMMLQGSHTCVLIWSLGHDCAWGTNFREAAAYIRGLDRVRPLTFHLPMSVPEEEEPLDIWPVHYVDWRQPFDVCYDQMVVFHTPGAENEIGYMTGQAEADRPVLHEVWSPVACHNRDEIQKDPYIRQFWGESIRRFAEKSYRTEGCLGGAVLAGVDEDGSFEDMGKYEWGILDKNHCPKPEYGALRRAYSPVVLGSVVEKEGELVIEVENRFLYTDLDQCRLRVNGREQVETVLRGEPGSVTEYRIALKELEEGETVGLKSESEDRDIAGLEPEPADRDIAGLEPEPEDRDIVSLVFESGDGSREYISYRIPVEAYKGKTSAAAEPSVSEVKSLAIQWKEWPSGEADRGNRRRSLLVGNDSFTYEFSGETCLLLRADAGGRRILAGGPCLNCTGFLLGEWRGTGLNAESCGEKVQVTILGGYRDSLDICFRLVISPDGTLDTSYEIIKLYRHMPHTVKAEIGMDVGGLNEKGVSYLLAEGICRSCEEKSGLSRSCEEKSGLSRSCEEKSGLSQGCEEKVSRSRSFQITDDLGCGVVVCLKGEERVHLERAPWLTPEAVIDDRNPRMVFTGNWRRMDDYCGNYMGTETLGREAEDTMSLEFEGSGIRLYGPLDMNYGICDIYLDGEPAARGVSQYPDKVDFPGMSRGYEKRYGQLIFEAHHLKEGVHRLLVKVTGRAVPGAQNTYTSIDYAVLEGMDYPEGIRLNVNQDYNYTRLVRGCYRRPRVELIPGVRESFRMKLIRK